MCGDGKESYRPLPPNIDIVCPLCGYRQTVASDAWLFQSTQGHGYTCGSGKCPSHTYMVRDVVPPKSPEELLRAGEKIKRSNGTEFQYDYLR